MKSFAMLILLLAGGAIWAAEKPPLSPALLQAKKAYLDNRTHASVGDKAYASLKKWDRFEMVNDPKDADIIFVFSLEETSGKVVSSSGQGFGSVRSTYIPNNGSTTMTVIDAKTQTTLYSDARTWNGAWARKYETGKLIDGLQKRMEKQK
jgi:hypothetical protein